MGYDEEREYVSRTDWNEVDAPSLAIVEAVATATDRDPEEVEQLYAVIDPDALDNLVRQQRPTRDGENVCVSFRFGGCTVIVSADGRIAVSPRND